MYPSQDTAPSVYRQSFSGGVEVSGAMLGQVGGCLAYSGKASEARGAAITENSHSASVG